MNFSTHLQLQWRFLTLQHRLDLSRLLVEVLNVLLISMDFFLKPTNKLK